MSDSHGAAFTAGAQSTLLPQVSDVHNRTMVADVTDTFAVAQAVEVAWGVALMKPQSTGALAV